MPFCPFHPPVLHLSCPSFTYTYVHSNHILRGAGSSDRGPSRAAQDEDGFKSIFNGKDLTGWEGAAGWWSVEDGCLTGITTKEKPLKAPTYLFYRGAKPADFELRAKFKMIGGNSGINIRSNELPNFDVQGYQADMDAGNAYTGTIYECGLRATTIANRGQKVEYDATGKKTVTPLAKSAADLAKVIKANDWNEYVIIVRGPEVTLKINGELMCQLIDHDKRAIPAGFITLQLHPGPAMKVQFKDMRLKQ